MVGHHRLFNPEPTATARLPMVGHHRLLTRSQRRRRHPPRSAVAVRSGLNESAISVAPVQPPLAVAVGSGFPHNILPKPQHRPSISQSPLGVRNARSACRGGPPSSHLNPEPTATCRLSSPHRRRRWLRVKRERHKRSALCSRRCAVAVGSGLNEMRKSVGCVRDAPLVSDGSAGASRTHPTPLAAQAATPL